MGWRFDGESCALPAACDFGCFGAASCLRRIAAEAGEHTLEVECRDAVDQEKTSEAKFTRAASGAVVLALA